MDAQVVWKQGLQFEGKADSNHPIVMGSSPEDGFGPVEMILTGLAGCTAMDVISILEKKRQIVTAFEVRSHGDRATEYPKVFTDFTLHYVVTGENIDPAAVERAIELSMTKYCAVGAMLSQVAPIHHTFEVIESAAVAAN